MTAIPADVLHRLYRGYCIAKFPYTHEFYADAEARDAHIDYDARSYYHLGHDAEEDDVDGHPDPLAGLVEAAYKAGQETLPWHYGVRDSAGTVQPFGTDLAAALNYAQPVDCYPQLAVLRWRQGPVEEAVLPVEVADV